MRSLSALFGAATVPLAYCIGAELSSRRAGLITAALVAVNPMLIWYSQEARSYALLVFFCAASLLFFARALRTRSGPRPGALGARLGARPLQPLLRLLRGRRSRRSGCWSRCARAGASCCRRSAGSPLVGLALIPLISAQVNPTHIGWIDDSLLSTRFFQTGISFLVGETGHVIAEPPRERYALLPGDPGRRCPAARRRARHRGGAARRAARPRRSASAWRRWRWRRPGRQGLRGRAQPAARPACRSPSRPAIGFAVERARRLGLLLAVVLCAYWVAFDIHVTQTPNLQRPDFRGITEALGPPQRPAGDRHLEARRRPGPLLPPRPLASASTAARRRCARST